MQGGNTGNNLEMRCQFLTCRLPSQSSNPLHVRSTYTCKYFGPGQPNAEAQPALDHLPSCQPRALSPPFTTKIQWYLCSLKHRKRYLLTTITYNVSVENEILIIGPKPAVKCGSAFYRNSIAMTCLRHSALSLLCLALFPRHRP